MADHQEDFLKKYFHLAYKLSLSDILDQISELDRFSVRLCEKGFLTEDDVFRIIQASDRKSRKDVLHKILLGKEDYWLASPVDPKDSGVLAAICELDASAADYTVVTALEAFHHILDKVLDSDTPVKVSIWGKSKPRACDDLDLDVHLRKLAYSLSLPAILTHVKDLHVFCKTLFSSGVITKEELNKFFPTSRQKVACFLMGKDEKAVFTCLADETLVATAEKMKKKAYNYVVNVVLDETPQSPPDQTSVGRWALIGLASAGAGIAAMVSAPLVIAAAGFGSGGIVAGSFAAWFMSTYGGAVSAGSLCALLQSAGAAGLAASTTAGIGAAGTGASFGILSGIVAIIKKFKKTNVRKRFTDNM